MPVGCLGSSQQGGQNVDHVRVLVVDEARGPALHGLRQGIRDYNGSRGADPEDHARPDLLPPSSVAEATLEAVRRELGGKNGCVVIVLGNGPWSLGGFDGTPRRLSPLVKLAYDLLDGPEPRPYVVLAVDPTVGSDEDPQFTAPCILAWMLSDVSAVVDQQLLNLPTVARYVLADVGRRGAMSNRWIPLVGKPSEKLAALKDTSFNQRSGYIRAAVGRREPSWQGAFRAAIAIAQVPRIPPGQTATGRRSFGTPSLAAWLNRQAQWSLFEFHPGGLDDLLRRLELEWCADDIEAETYWIPESRTLLPSYARRVGRFPRHQPIVRGMNHEEVPVAIYRALNDVELKAERTFDGVPFAWYSRPAG